MKTMHFHSLSSKVTSIVYIFQAQVPEMGSHSADTHNSVGFTVKEDLSRNATGNVEDSTQFD